VKFYHNGKAYRTSSHSAVKSEAQKLLRVYLGEIAQGTFTGLKTAKDTYTVKEMLDDFERDCIARGLNAMDRVTSHINKVREVLGNLDVSHLVERRIDLYIKERLKKVGRVTVNREIQLLSQALRLAYEKKLVPAIPKIKKFREDNARQSFFERHEFEAVLSHLPVDLKGFVLFAYYSGWRKNEIARLEWRDVEQDAIRLRSELSKTREGRFLLLVGEIREIIERRRSERHELIPLVFHRSGKPVQRFDKSWRTACRKAGCAGKLFHDFRRTATRNMRRAGVQETTIMKITGHKTRIMFDRYNIISETDMEEGLKKTQELLQKDRKITRLGTPQAQLSERG
jgi:integrase